MASIGLSVCGILAPIVYVATVCVGGRMRKDYSHQSRAISELTERDAPNKGGLDAGFIIYNILSILGASGIYMGLSWMGGNWHAGSALLVTATCVSILMSIFPMDPVSKESATPSTTAGQIHIAAGVIYAVLVLIATGLLANAAITSQRFNSYGIFTAICLAVEVVGGLCAAITASKLHPYMGLTERVAIGVYLVWFFITCCLVASSFFV